MADWRDSGHPFSSAVPSNSFWIHALHGRKCSCHDKTEQCLISQMALKQNHKEFILQCNNYVQIIIKNFLSHPQKGECTRNQTSVPGIFFNISDHQLFSPSMQSGCHWKFGFWLRTYSFRLNLPPSLILMQSLSNLTNKIQRSPI